VTLPIDPRATAAQALASIVFDGASMRAAFAEFSTKLPQARDRALLSALLHEGARWWLRYVAALPHLLDKPLASREREIEALLVLGLIQIQVMKMPEYAAVAATVQAARNLRKPGFAGLINAILRRWLRERDTLMPLIDADAATRSAHPQWLLDLFAKDWGDASSNIAEANNREAPLWLRVNAKRSSRDNVIAQFATASIAVESVAGLSHALVLPTSADVTQLPGFSDGHFSVQDGAAQFAAGLLDLNPGQRVLDACAAPGGKTAHILESADVELLAIDRDERRLPRMRENLERLGLNRPRVSLRAADASQPSSWWDGKLFDRILLDAPCSASGIVRRQPDIKLHRRPTDIDAMRKTQASLLDALWPLLKPGGRLVYATCSVLADENAHQVSTFLSRRPDAHPTASRPENWRIAGAGSQNLPAEHGMDGFFYAVVEKNN
jgi:16S rRNA (cytosine967-C5)-methyltransferase